MNNQQTKTYKGHIIRIGKHIRAGFRTTYVIFIDGEFVPQAFELYTFKTALSAARQHIDSKSTQTTNNFNHLSLEKAV